MGLECLLRHRNNLIHTDLEITEFCIFSEQPVNKCRFFFFFDKSKNGKVLRTIFLNNWSFEKQSCKGFIIILIFYQCEQKVKIVQDLEGKV